MRSDSNGPAHEGPADTLQQADSFNYGYSYGGGYTEAADNNGYPPLAQANNGIQSPFQNTQSSPFQSGISSPFNSGVRSPFQHGSGYTQPIEAETTVEQPGYQPYQHETPAVTSYQPDAYAPVNSAPATTTATHAWDDDDDLGFGNTKKVTEKPKDEMTEGNAAREEKPNEVSVEEKKEEKAGGWGIFSLFGRKEKEQPAEEKKAVKANLGEASSFYYDEKEKRWVNKLVSGENMRLQYDLFTYINYRMMLNRKLPLHHHHLKRLHHSLDPLWLWLFLWVRLLLLWVHPRLLCLD